MTFERYNDSMKAIAQSSISDDEDEFEDKVSTLFADAKRRKIVEEDKYLDRMSKIIRRDFFSYTEFPDKLSASNSATPATCYTPSSERSTNSTTQSINSDKLASNLSLNGYLAKYTSEDNAYFDKQQCKELRRHKHKYPWLHKKDIASKLNQANTQSNTSIVLKSKDEESLIQASHNPNNTLFYPAPTVPSDFESTTIINYDSSKYMNDSAFKQPLPVSGKPKINEISDKITLRGNVAGSETPCVGGYKLVMPSELAATTGETNAKIKQKNYFLLPESPRDEFANRLYQRRISQSMNRAKKSSSTPLSRSSSSLRDVGFKLTPGSIKKEVKR